MYRKRFAEGEICGRRKLVSEKTCPLNSRESLIYFPWIIPTILQEHRAMQAMQWTLRTPSQCPLLASQPLLYLPIVYNLPLRLPRHAHIGINGSTKGGEPSTPQRSSLRPSISSQYSSCYTTRSGTVSQVRLGAKAFDTAFSPGVDSADDGKVLG